MDDKDHTGRAPTTRRLFDGSDITLREFQLVVLDGAQAGLLVTLGEDPVSIGSAPDNDLVLVDPSISRHHARIEGSPEGLVLRDLGSTNGTFVNGMRIREGILSLESLLKLGTTTLRFQRHVSRMDVPASPATSFGKLIGRSPAMRRLFSVLERAAPTEATILISGPSGTGKELVAQSIHEGSPRKNGPFVVLDCGAVDPSLISSEIFGHEAGAFTGAASRRAGVFEQARGGTVFIDEIGELGLDLQPKLLRVLESRSLRRLGGNATISLDVRIVSATNRDLEKMVANGTFREDLYYRLSQLQITLPSLDSRKEDIPLIVQSFLDRLPSPRGPRKLSTEAMARLWVASYPGNVRQLRNIVERAAMIAGGDLIEAQDLLLPEGSGAPATAVPASRPADSEKQRILEALEGNDLVLIRAARSLGVAVNTLKARMKRLGIPIPQRKGMPGPRGGAGPSDLES